MARLHRASLLHRAIDFVINNSSDVLDRGYSGCSFFHYRDAA
jgi:hypothetical protein